MTRKNRRSFSLNKNIAVFSGLLLLLGLSVFFAVQKFFPLLNHVAFYQQSFRVDTQTIPIPYYLSVIPFIMLFFVIASFFIKLFISSLKVQFLRRKLNREKIEIQKANIITQQLDLKDKVVFVKSEEKFAFCLGVSNTKIYISTGLFLTLTNEELKAVLMHEQYHLENHDTFTMILASAAHSIFPYFPFINDLIDKYKIEREIAADKYAVERVGNQYSLVSVLRKLLVFPTNHSVAVAAIADQDTLEPRIYALLNKSYTVSGFRIKNIVISIFSFLVVVALNTSPMNAQELHHDHYDVVILSPDSNLPDSHMNEKLFRFNQN